MGSFPGKKLSYTLYYHEETPLSGPPYPSQEGMSPGLGLPHAIHALALLSPYPNMMLLTLPPTHP